jgi:hypothetical protein
VHESAIRTQLARAYATVCPQLAKADVQALTKGSGFDPKRSLGTFSPERHMDCDSVV